MWFANTIFYSMGYFFVLLMLSFTLQEVFHLRESSLFIFLLLLALCLVLNPKYHCCYSVAQSCPALWDCVDWRIPGFGRGTILVSCDNHNKLSQTRWLLLPLRSHGQNSLAGYSPRGQRELDMTEWLRTHMGGFKTSEVILAQFWRLKVWNQRIGMATFPPNSLGENLSWLLPAPGGFSCSSACGSINLVSVLSLLSFLLCLLFWLSNLPLPYSLKGICHWVCCCCCC